MATGDIADPEYYFDVTSQRWWVRNPGDTSWERLAQDRVDELGLHNAVLREECTFVDTSLADYEDAVSRMTTKNSVEAKSGTVLKSTVCQSPPEVSSQESKPRGHSGAAAADDDDVSVDDESLPSISYANSVSSHSFDRVESTHFFPMPSGETELEKQESLQDRFMKHASPRCDEKPLASFNSEREVGKSAEKQVDKSASFPRGSRRTGTCGEIIQNQLSNLMADVAEVKRGYEAKQTKSIEKVESFVRSAVRHVTNKDNSGIGDCIRAIAAERERMKKMASLKAEPAMPPVQYQRLMERARTMAAISQENDSKGKGHRKSRLHSMLADLQREVSGSNSDAAHNNVTFDASSDSDADEQPPAAESGMESLMSQRLSLRRTSTRDANTVTE